MHIQIPDGNWEWFHIHPLHGLQDYRTFRNIHENSIRSTHPFEAFSTRLTNYLQNKINENVGKIRHNINFFLVPYNSSNIRKGLKRHEHFIESIRLTDETLANTYFASIRSSTINR